MTHSFRNVYADEQRAAAYDALEFPGTYYLAFRDLPAIFARHLSGRRALDFGCGAGRSSRFLAKLGFDVLGVDVADEMLARAVARDPAGRYERVPDGDLSGLDAGAHDLVLCAFTFDNIPSRDKRQRLFDGLVRTLAPGGRIVNLVSAPEIYVHQWVSFSTRDFPENRSARSGDIVRIVMLDVPDRRPVEDAFWTDEDYRAWYEAAGLELLATHRPLGLPSDPHPWKTEAELSPWAIYVLGHAGR